MDTWSVLTHEAGQQLCSSGLITTPGEGSLRGGGHTAASVRLAPRQWPGGSASLPGSQLPPRPCAPEHQRRTKPPGEAGSPPPWAGGEEGGLSSHSDTGLQEDEEGPSSSTPLRSGPETAAANCPPVQGHAKDDGDSLGFRRERRWALLQHQVRNPSPSSRLLMAFSSAKRPTRHRPQVWTESLVGGGPGPVREQCLRTVGSMGRRGRVPSGLAPTERAPCGWELSRAPQDTVNRSSFIWSHSRALMGEDPAQPRRETLLQNPAERQSQRSVNGAG